MNNKELPSYARLVRNTPLPKIVLCRQTFPASKIENPEKSVADAMAKASATDKIKPGMSIAITGGSRGIAAYPELLSEIVSQVKVRGATPFVVPSMGSHGGATAEGQTELLAKLGITEDVIKCPILSSMETDNIGTLKNGMPVHMDRVANAADGIILFNRIKPHTGFRAPNESGLVKMLAIGLGKQSGAEHCHSQGNDALPINIEAMARTKLERCKVLFGIGTIENAYDQLSQVMVLDSVGLIEAEQPLLRIAMENMPRLPVGPQNEPTASGKLDVLVVDQIGKEFSGAGMDPNITHRFVSPKIKSYLNINRLVALDLSSRSNGNGLGAARADVVTARLESQFNREAVYANALTANSLAQAKMPLVMPCDHSAIQTAVKTCGVKDTSKVRLLRIPNTLHLEYFYASEGMLGELEQRSNVEVIGDLGHMKFSDGHLTSAWPDTREK